MQIKTIPTNQIRRKTKNANLIDWLPLFLLWPFGAMVRAFAKFRSPNAKWVVWMFCIFFGFVFVHSYYVDMDAYSYVERFKYVHDNWFGFKSLLQLFYSDDAKYVDIYQPLVTWIMAYFTSNPRWLFMVFSAVLGFFYVQNLWLIFEKFNAKEKIDVVIFLFIIAFAIIIPIWNINGVRMWTAAHIYLYGLLRYFLKNKKNSITWIVLSLFFHFSFILPVAAFILFRFVPKNITLLVVLFYMSSFVRELDMDFVKDSLSFLPDFLQSRVDVYTNQDYFNRTMVDAKPERALHELLSSYSLRYLLYGWVLLVTLKGKTWLDNNSDIKQLYVYGLFFGIIAQIAANVPSGGRFLTLVIFILYAIFILFIVHNRTKLTLYKWISLPFLIFIVFFNLRLGLSNIGISTFISNPILSLFIEDKMPLIEYIKRFL